MDTKLVEAVEEATGIAAWWPTVEPSPRWVRVRQGDKTIAESKSPLLHIDYDPPQHLPTYYFTLEEVDSNALVDPRTRDDGSTVWTVSVAESVFPEAAWTHHNPSGPLEPLAGRVTFSWFAGLDWYEEAEKVSVHARDPHKRVDVVASSRHVEVWHNGKKLADSHHPFLLFETMLPTRLYIPPEDVRLDLLAASPTATGCPYKGVATHLACEDGSDIAWSYHDPIAENPRIKDLISFYNEQVDLVIDGVPQDRPRTQWS